MWYMDSTSITMDSLVYFMDGSEPVPAYSHESSDRVRVIVLDAPFEAVV